MFKDNLFIKLYPMQRETNIWHYDLLLDGLSALDVHPVGFGRFQNRTCKDCEDASNALIYKFRV